MQIQALEERWCDVEAGRLSALPNNKGNWTAEQYYLRMIQYYTEGNQVTHHNSAPNGLSSHCQCKRQASSRISHAH